MIEEDSLTESGEESADQPPRTIWQNRWLLVAGIILLVPTLIWLLLDAGKGPAEVPEQSEAELMAMEAEMMPDNPSEELDEPGIYDATYYTAEQVVFPDSEEVIGVEVDGHACAYLLGGMNDVDQHIVHHDLGDQKLTVTYCDKSQCVAVFDRAETTAEIRNGGFSGETLWLLYDGKRFEQDAPDIPLTNYPSERTTWGEWKKQHPDTLVYVGLGLSFGKTLKENDTVDQELQ